MPATGTSRRDDQPGAVGSKSSTTLPGDLRAAGAGDDLIVERNAVVAEGVDERGKVFDMKHEAVPASGPGRRRSGIGGR